MDLHPRKQALQRVNRKASGPVSASQAVALRRAKPTDAAPHLRTPSPSHFSATKAHEHNAKYMQEFKEGLTLLGRDQGKAAPEAGSTKVSGTAHTTYACTEEVFAIHDPSTWSAGPTDTAGTLFNASDRPLLCGSLSDTSFAVGSADHAVYVVSHDHRFEMLAVYASLTAPKETFDGSVLSGGMDGRLCLWKSASFSRCIQLQAHEASISKLLIDAQRPLAVSSDTSGKVRLWNLDSFSERCAPAREYTCGSVPVMDVAYLGSILVAACRNGSVQVFDAIGGASRTLRAHRGHSTCVCAISSDEFITGGADGCIGFIDLRSRTDQPVASLRVHCNAEGAGAVGGMVLSNATETTPYVVSFGADRTVCLTDPRMSQRAVVQRWTSHRDFVYCMAIGVPFVFSGGGDGNIVCHDIRDGSVKFGLGACENGAVRCLRGSYKRLYVANDAGDVIRYSFT